MGKNEEERMGGHQTLIEHLLYARYYAFWFHKLLILITFVQKLSPLLVRQLTSWQVTKWLGSVLMVRRWWECKVDSQPCEYLPNLEVAAPWGSHLFLPTLGEAACVLLKVVNNWEEIIKPVSVGILKDILWKKQNHTNKSFLFSNIYKHLYLVWMVN